MTDRLLEQLRRLTEEAAVRATTDAARQGLREVLNRIDGPIRLAIAGKVKVGKSTLLNALVGEELAPTDAGECTRIVTWYRYSDRPYAKVFPVDGTPEERPYRRGDAALDVDLGDRSAQEVRRLEIGWPSSRLSDLDLIDTPGIASISAEASARTHQALSAESGRAPQADAVLYLLRHTHASDIRFLEAFHDDAVGHGTPVNTVGVLSRADEIGSSRLNAMEVAGRVAARYQGDQRLHRLCPVVVPVNGLLAHAAATLRESEYAALRAVASAPEVEVAELLLTADRFAGRTSPVPVSAAERAALLDRLGLFGVRLAVQLLRSGVRDSTSLARTLGDVSGLQRLREVVVVQFESRARVLKARSAVSALEAVLARDGCVDSPALQRQLEQLTSSAHEFEEVRVLLELRAGEFSLTPAREAQLDLLMGGAGHDPATRLGMRPDSPPEDVRAAAVDALRVWQGVAAHPLSSRSTQIAAQAAARSVEGLLNDAVPST